MRAYSRCDGNTRDSRTRKSMTWSVRKHFPQSGMSNRVHKNIYMPRYGFASRDYRTSSSSWYYQERCDEVMLDLRTTNGWNLYSLPYFWIRVYEHRMTLIVSYGSRRCRIRCSVVSWRESGHRMHISLSKCAVCSSLRPPITLNPSFNENTTTRKHSKSAF